MYIDSFGVCWKVGASIDKVTVGVLSPVSAARMILGQSILLSLEEVSPSHSTHRGDAFLDNLSQQKPFFYI